MNAGTAAGRLEPPTALEHRCPLCGAGFAEEEHCSSCPMTSYCHTLCCPNCGYSFVERSSIVDFVRRLARRWRPRRDTGGNARG